MKTTVIMIRHGQSVANAEDRFAGHSDFDLTELGKKQAELAASYHFGKTQIDAIYSSDLLRAYNTALPFSKLYGIPIEKREGLRELYAGLWEGHTISELVELYRDDMKAWRDDFSNARCTGGESTQELYVRVVKEVLSIARENVGKTLLLATHATPIRAIEAFSRGLPKERIHEVSFCKNTSLNFFEYDSEQNTLIPIKLNSVEHLDSSLVTSVPASLRQIPGKDTPKD